MAQTFAQIAAKAKDAAFQARLTVAITEHCRFELERPRREGATPPESPERYAWTQSLARSVLRELHHADNRERMARLCLLPAEWGTWDPEDDDQLQARAAERFLAFAHDAPPT